MQYRQLGSSGIEASVIGLGTTAIGGTEDIKPDDKASIRTIHAALDHGFNLIDTAPSYGWGRAEEIVGRAIKGRRDKVVIATKCGVWWQDKRGSFNGLKDGRRTYISLHPDTIKIELENSLKRLGVDTIDLLQCHKPAIPPHQTPIAETMECLLDLKRQGKIRAIGVSNVSFDQLEEYLLAGDLDSNQFRYSMLVRSPEQNTLPYCANKKIATLTYLSLEQGLLTGKMGADYIFGQNDFRANIGDYMPWFKSHNRQKLRHMFLGWTDIINKYECSFSALTLAWTAAQTGATHILSGCKDIEQAEANAKAGSIKLTKEELLRIRKDVVALGEAS